jgi:hypothetical protein
MPNWGRKIILKMIPLANATKLITGKAFVLPWKNKGMEKIV